jgi:hypothetical protein
MGCIGFCMPLRCHASRLLTPFCSYHSSPPAPSRPPSLSTLSSPLPLCSLGACAPHARCRHCWCYRQATAGDDRGHAACGSGPPVPCPRRRAATTHPGHHTCLQRAGHVRGANPRWRGGCGRERRGSKDSRFGLHCTLVHFRLKHDSVCVVRCVVSCVCLWTVRIVCWRHLHRRNVCVSVRFSTHPPHFFPRCELQTDPLVGSSCTPSETRRR